MSDYISREEALKKICGKKCGCNFDECGYTEPCTYGKILEELPSADVRENIHGEWKRISPAGIYECSECGQNVMTNDIECYKFCHGCGARMKGGE